jgi:2-keto-3-deoxy-L-rhamnonate aldolase RhmA
MNHHLRERLLEGDLLVGTIVTLPTPEVSEILATAGFDWLFVDVEHAPMGFRDAQVILQAAGNVCPCLVRVPAGEEIWIKKALDIGAAGVIVPQVHAAAQAERIVGLCKYPPEGSRGVGVARAQGYGSRLNEYIATANEQLAVVIQAESEEAVRNIDSIVRVPGVDAIFIGPYDLSSSLGKPGAVTDPEVTGAIAAVRESCSNAGVALGAFGVDALAVQPFIEQAFTLIAVGIDTLYLSRAARDVLSGIRDTSLSPD